MSLAIAQELLGIPFREGGRDFRPLHGGTDCLGIVLEFRRRLGLRAEDPWGAIHWRGDAREHWPSWLRPVSGPIENGDVAITVDGAHILVYAGSGYILEAVRDAGSRLRRCVPTTDQRWWR